MDSMQRLATYLEADLHEHAAVALEAGPNGTGTVTVEPHEPAAMTLTVTGGRDEILGIEFAGVAAVECLGNRRTLQGRTMQPVDELSLLISAVATGGAELFASPVRGRLLCLGGPTAERSRRVRRMRQVGGWAPIAPELSPMSTLLRTIDPATTLILPAYRLPLPRQSGLELAV
ncbi:hypothetical protein [Herbiconiux sp.]|uniref:hypothetical protein n=1 Tax=Herbiconiux sp. TaxID=1871186 RepID=UPI0025BEC331|nr:hypothetical protein [Herbiconiux sp.]